ncbi:MAG: DegT/DnrJ/EryC1/StrS family aminotransferase [Bryobacteraceae bacterium]
MSELALLGGRPVRTRGFPAWPRPTPRDRARLQEVLESGNWGGHPFPNRLAREFSSKFAAYHGASYGCCVANGTIALVAALQAAGIRYGDEVIVPAYTWDGTAGAVLYAGGVPVFADIDPDTYCLDVASARRAVTPRTRAIIPVHLAMRFAGMEAVLALASEYGLKVIEDCAHAHGGAYNGRGAGSMGDLGCFSFQSSKIMACGEGGAVITSRLEIFEVLQSIVNCGRASETGRFHRRIVGSNYRMTEFQAALLLGQLEELPKLAARRARHAALLTRELAGIPGISPLPPQPAITREAIYNYVFRYRRPEASRDLFAAALDREGIPCDGRFYEAVYRSDLFQVNPADFPQVGDRDYAACRCPAAERAAYDESVWLPHFLLLGDENDVEDIVRAVRKVIAHLGELAGVDPALAGVKSMSRAERSKAERKNY